MSNTSSKKPAEKAIETAPQPTKNADVDQAVAAQNSPKYWGPFAGISWALLIYLVPQLLGGFVISIYPLLHHWSTARTNNWLTNATTAQFAYTVFVEVVAVSMVAMLLSHYRAAWRYIGLMWLRWKDTLYAVAAFGIYLTLYAIMVEIVIKLFPSFNATQQQNVGFQNTTTAIELWMAFISLVVLPPIAEEIIFRGFLYKGIRRKWNVVVATLVTSVCFAAPHLLEGVGGLLWVGALDTFILSVVLCGLREKTDRIGPGMIVHALKNGLAFAVLFLFHSH